MALMPERRKTSWSDRLQENQRTALAFGVLLIAIVAIVVAVLFFF